MKNNRRSWLKQTSLAFAALSLAPLKNFASPTRQLPGKPFNDFIRLNSNENPYGPSPLARKAMEETIHISNRYPWAITADLIPAIAEKNNVTTDQVLIGAGSTEILDLCVYLLAAKKGSFILANPTFGPWAKTAERLGLQKISVPLLADKQYDLPAMLNAIKADTRMIHVCNPNNPTGTICDRDILISFIREASKKVLVLVDEAYIDYTTQNSLSNLVRENQNLIVVKTFSKIYGLAGARIGYALAHPNTIEQLSQLQTWANGGISAVTLAAALASLKDKDFVYDSFTLNEKARKYTTEQLERMEIHCIPSHSNFIYFSLVNYKKDFFNQLKMNNITGTKVYEEKGKWSRITVGTIKEMQMFISAIG